MIIAPSFMVVGSEFPHSLSSRRDRMIVMMIRAYLRHAVFMRYPYPAPERERAIFKTTLRVEYIPSVDTEGYCVCEFQVFWNSPWTSKKLPMPHDHKTCPRSRGHGTRSVGRPRGIAPTNYKYLPLSSS